MSSAEPANYLKWRLDHLGQGKVIKHMMNANFQDIFQLTKRTGETRIKMDNLKFRAQGIGGMIGIAAGALGGPLGTVVGYGVGRSIGNYIGGALSNKYYGRDYSGINENLVLARQRNSQLMYQHAVHGSLGEMIDTLYQNNIKDEQKVIQDVVVL